MQRNRTSSMSGSYREIHTSDKQDTMGVDQHLLHSNSSLSGSSRQPVSCRKYVSDTSSPKRVNQCFLHPSASSPNSSSSSLSPNNSYHRLRKLSQTSPTQDVGRKLFGSPARSSNDFSHNEQDHSTPRPSVVLGFDSNEEVTFVPDEKTVIVCNANTRTPGGHAIFDENCPTPSYFQRQNSPYRVLCNDQTSSNGHSKKMPDEWKSKNRLWSLTSNDSSGYFCRICHQGEHDEPLIWPCICTGTMGAMHQTCVEKWLGMAGSDRCEICGFAFLTERKSKPFMQWVCNPTSPRERKNLLTDCLCFLVLTPLATISMWLCIVGAQHYQGQATSDEHPRHSWETVGLSVLTVFLVLIYVVWCVVAIRYHRKTFHKWQNQNQSVRVLNRSPNHSHKFKLGRRQDFSDSKPVRNVASESYPIDLNNNSLVSIGSNNCSPVNRMIAYDQGHSPDKSERYNLEDFNVCSCRTPTGPMRNPVSMTTPKNVSVSVRIPAESLVKSMPQKFHFSGSTSAMPGSPSGRMLRLGASSRPSRKAGSALAMPRSTSRPLRKAGSVPGRSATPRFTSRHLGDLVSPMSSSPSGYTPMSGSVSGYCVRPVSTSGHPSMLGSASGHSAVSRRLGSASGYTPVPAAASNNSTIPGFISVHPVMLGSASGYAEMAGSASQYFRNGRIPESASGQLGVPGFTSGHLGKPGSPSWPSIPTSGAVNLAMPGSISGHHEKPGSTSQHSPLSGSNSGHLGKPESASEIPGFTYGNPAISESVSGHTPNPGSASEHSVVPGSASAKAEISGSAAENSQKLGSASGHTPMPESASEHSGKPGSTSEDSAKPGSAAGNPEMLRSASEHSEKLGSASGHPGKPGSASEHSAIPGPTSGSSKMSGSASGALPGSASGQSTRPESDSGKSHISGSNYRDIAMPGSAPGQQERPGSAPSVIPGSSSRQMEVTGFAPKQSLFMSSKPGKSQV